MASRNASSSIRKSHSHTNHPPPPRRCLCSPTNHPGSFRCSKHKKPTQAVVAPTSHHHWEEPSSMAAKDNSLKAILLQMNKAPSHDLHKKKTFQQKPTRFCLINGNRGAVAVS